MSPSLVVPETFCGPPTSGNGGWCAGALSALAGTGSALGRTVEVTLRLPPPLAVPLEVEQDDGTWRAADAQGRTVLSARVLAPGEVALDPSEEVPLEAARTAEGRYAGHRSHPFPTCFSCGPARAEGDGLRIFPGPVADRPGLAAAPWTPHAATYEIVWAALDCAGAWATGIEDSPRVLGRMTARVDRLPEIGATHVVVGEALGSEGRKHHARTTLRAPDGSVLGVARQVWIDVTPG